MGCSESVEKAKEHLKALYANAEEDEQSVSKSIKKSGKYTFKGPEKKERRKFAPPTKVMKPTKGKGSYKRNKTIKESFDSLVSDILSRHA